MTTNMYIIPIEKNGLGGKPSGYEREHSLLQNYSKELNHSLMMHGNRCVHSFFLLFGLSHRPWKVFKYIITVRDGETMGCVLSVQLRCSMKWSKQSK